MSKEIKDLEERLLLPSFDKITILRKFKEGISDVLVHTLLQPKLTQISIKLMYCLRELSHEFTDLELKKPVIESDEDLITYADRSAHVLKLAKVLLEPSEFNISIVKRALNQLEVDNEYLNKKKVGHSLELYLREIDEQDDFLLFEQIRSIPEKEKKFDSVSTSLIDFDTSKMATTKPSLNYQKNEDEKSKDLSIEEHDNIMHTEFIDNVKRHLLDNKDEGPPFVLDAETNKEKELILKDNDNDEEIQKEEDTLLIKPTGASWGKKTATGEQDRSAIKEDPEEKKKKKKIDDKLEFEKKDDFGNL